MAVRIHRYLLLAALFLAACGGTPATEEPAPGQPSTTPAVVTATVSPVASTPLPPLAETVPPPATPTAALWDLLPAATRSAPVTDLAVTAEDVFVYPVPEIYEGDAVTFVVRPAVPEFVDSSAVGVELAVGDSLNLSTTLTTNNLSGSPSALFAWDWKTQGQIGEHEVTVTLDPANLIVAGDEDVTNNRVTLSVPVRPATWRPARELGAEWLTAETACCVLHVVSGTAAHRDLRQIQEMVGAAVDEAAMTLGVTPLEPLHFYFIDRVIGQGGYAGSTIVVSYLDRNYVGEGVAELITHEAVHILDQQFATNRLAALAEGLSVWVTGGHYKVEDIDQRVRALRETGLYVPLAQLVDDFYTQQHEVGYLESAGFLNFLVQRYGWERVKAFYAGAGGSGSATPSQTLDTALQTHFGQTLAETESSWLAYLQGLPRDAQDVADLLATIRYYNLVRDYQLQFDPTAHFLQAWLPSPRELEERQLTADLNRHPATPLNITLEVMFLDVDRAIRNGDYDGANLILDSIERALANDGVFVDPLGMDYNKIVVKLAAVGVEVHQLELDGNRAIAMVTEGRRPNLREMNLSLRNRTWVLIN